MIWVMITYNKYFIQLLISMAKKKSIDCKESSSWDLVNNSTNIVADATSKVLFEPLFDGYAVNENGIYFSWEKILHADPETFEVLKEWYARDKKNIYFLGKSLGVIFTGKNFSSLNPATIEILDDRYVKNKDAVYFHSLWEYPYVKFHWVKIVESADPETFKVLCRGYAKDSNSVYYNAKKIEWVDIKTFEFLKWYCVKDKHNVYYRWEKIEWADLQSFEVMSPMTAKDKNTTYVLWKKSTLDKTV